jgi:hypothetical protein
MRVRARAGRCFDGAETSGVCGVSNGNCAKDAGAETSTAAPAMVMTTAIRLTLPSPVDASTLAHRGAAVNARASSTRGNGALLGRLRTLA